MDVEKISEIMRKQLGSEDERVYGSKLLEKSQKIIKSLTI